MHQGACRTPGLVISSGNRLTRRPAIVRPDCSEGPVRPLRARTDKVLLACEIESGATLLMQPNESGELDECMQCTLSKVRMCSTGHDGCQRACLPGNVEIGV